MGGTQRVPLEKGRAFCEKPQLIDSLKAFFGQQVNLRVRGDDTAKDTHHWPCAKICQNRNQ